MADEVVSQLALDAAQVLQTLGQLNVAFGKYTQTLQQNAQSSATFNRGQDQIVAGVGRVSEALQAQKKLAADVADQLRTSFQSGFANPTLTEIKKVNDAFAALQKTIIGTGASQGQISNVLKNLGSTGFTGIDAKIQSAIIAAKQASQALGQSNAVGTLSINQAAVAANAKQQAQALAQQQALVSAQVAQGFAARFNTAGADPAALNRFQIAVQRLQTVSQNSKLSVSQLSNVMSNLGQVFTGAQGKVAAAATQVQKLGQTLSGVTTTATGFGLNLQSVISRFTFLEALRGLNALQSAFSQSIPNAINFERQLAQVATISGESDQNLDQLGVRVTLLANEFGKPAPEVAAGLYHALSNQVGDTAQTVQFLTEALKFSKSAVTDVSSSVDALSGVQNAYGQSSAQASHNADVLFRTIDLGRVTAKELGDSFGRILPIAAQLGVRLEEVSAAISTATVQGVKFQDAQTQILNLLIASLKPTGDFKARMKELGIETTQAGIAADGFIGFFSKLSEGAKSSEELAKLFPNLRGLRGEISLFSDSGKKLTDFLQQIDESAHAAQKAFETVQFSNAEQVSNELTRIQNQLTQGFGRDVVGALASLNKAFGGTAEAVVFLGEALAAAFGGAVVFTAVNQMIQVVTSLGGVFGITATAATGFGLAAVAIVGAVAVAFKTLQPRDFSVPFIEEVEKMRIEAAKFATDSANQLHEANRQITADLHAQVSDALAAEQQKQAIYNSSFDSAKSIEKATTDNFINSINQRERAFTTFISSIKALQDNAAQNAKKLIQSQQELELSVSQFRFQNSLEGKTQPQQAVALNQQVNKLLAAANAAFNQGSGDSAKKAIQDAVQLAEQFEKMTGNRTLLNKVIQASRALTAAELQQQNQQVSAAQQLEKENSGLINQARIQLELAQELDKQKQNALKENGGVENDQTRSLDTQIKTALTAADAITKKLNIGNLKVGSKVFNGTEVQNALDALRKVQQGPSLTFEFQKGIDTFRAEVKKQFEANPLTIQLGFTFDPEHDPKIQQKIADLKKQIDHGLQSEEASPGALNNFTGAVEVIDKAFAALKNDLGDVAAKAKLSEVPGLTGGGLNANNLKAIDDKLQATFNSLDAAKKKISDIFSDPTSFNEFGRLTKSAFDKLDEVLTPFKAAVLSASQPDADSFTKNIGKMAASIISATKSAAEFRQTLEGVQNDVQSGIDAQKQLNTISPKSNGKANQQIDQQEKEFEDAINAGAESAKRLSASVEQANNLIVASTQAPITEMKQLDTNITAIGPAGITAGEDAASGLSVIGETAISQISGVVLLTEALFRLAEANAASGGGGGGASGEELASRGAFMHFALGGVARGTDTVPAMLTPGEVVMNPKASRKFFSQLMAMNSGVQPSFRSDGGQVGDTFGDINVNITAGSSGDINARAIAKGIQREMRKRSIGRF